MLSGNAVSVMCALPVLGNVPVVVIAVVVVCARERAVVGLWHARIVSA